MFPSKTLKSVKIRKNKHETDKKKFRKNKAFNTNRTEKIRNIKLSISLRRNTIHD